MPPKRPRKRKGRKKKRAHMTVIHSFGRLGREYILSCSRYREGPGFITLLSGGAVMITTLSACVFLVDDGVSAKTSHRLLTGGEEGGLLSVSEFIKN